MLVMPQGIMGSPIYFMTEDNRWNMAKDFDPVPGTFAFVTDKSWIMDFDDCLGE